jgi:hypothetical protein
MSESKSLHLFGQLSILIAFIYGCENSESPKPSETIPPGTQSFSGNGSNGCLQSQIPATGSSYSLQTGEVTYEQDIKPILTAKCFSSCHDGTNGSAVSWKGSSSDLDYNQVANNKTFIAQVVASELSHTNQLGLSSDEIAKFAAWRTAGFPRGVVTNNPLQTSTPGVNSSSPLNCSSGQTPLPNGTTGEDALEALVNSELHKSCLAAGKLTDRDNDRCFDDIPLDMSWCNDTGIKDKFDELARAGQAMVGEISLRKGEGYQIEGCGVQQNTNHPHVTWIKRDTTGNKIMFWVSIGQSP